ncbi:MAG TPA: hypothetical protein VKR21_17085 [Solirubrobacteraceae bacterium]|nr:hypothetical protein [Solirubrobacteraceae bacterium]
MFTGNGTNGIAIDSATGKIYWADGNSGTINVGNLDGSGSPSTLFAGEVHPYGVAIDPAAGKLYWGNGGNPGAVRVGNLDGSGSASSLFSGESDPREVTIDPSANKIYWVDLGSRQIRDGSLDGSGSPSTLFTYGTSPGGIAIDSASGKIYWTDFDSGAILVANLNGTGSPQALFSGQSGPIGVALDPAAGRIYWADYATGIGSVQVGNLDGTGSPRDLFSGEVSPYMLAILRSPVGAGVPVVSGGSGVGSVLSCSQGLWSSDLLGAFLFHAPAGFAYQWTFDGGDVAGATSSTYVASAGGSYACRVTAANQAGSTVQTSTPFTVSGGRTPPLTVPKLTGVGQSHRRWREGRALPHIARVRAPVGTRFRFTLNESARMRFRFWQRLAGRRVNGRCVAVTAKDRGRRRCTRLVARGALSAALGSGAHVLRFQGRLSKRKRLRPGRYTLILTATDAAGQHATAKLVFTIVAAPRAAPGSTRAHRAM